MRMTLLNQRPELGSCKTQKTKRQNVLNRFFLALFAMLFLPIGAWAEDYFTINYTVNNSTNQIWVSDENNNLGDILGDGKMSYNATNNILTLNGIDLSCSGDHGSQVWNSFITFADWDEDFNHVIVQLVGQNFLEVDDFGRFFDGAGITFITDEANPGSLTITTADGWNGYMFVNHSTPITPTYNNGLCLIQNGNTYTIQTPVSYNITVAGTPVTSANASNVLNDDYSSVSYNATTNTLTLKGVHLNSANNGISVSSDLNINLVGYSNVGTINVTSGTLNFTTSTTLPGCLKTDITGNSTITYEAGTGLSWDGTMVKSSSTNPYIIYATGYKGNNDEYGNDNGDIVAYNNNGDIVELGNPDVSVVNSLYNTNIDYFRVPSVSGDPISSYLYPIDLEDNTLYTKAYFLFDWGTCTNKDVKVRVREYNSISSPNDGEFRSNEVSLPSEGGLVEIPLTGTVTSDNILLYFTSTTGEFSFIPISVGFLKTNGKAYNMWIGETQVTSANAGDVLGNGKVSFAESAGLDAGPTYTLTLNGAELTAPVKVGLDNLTIDIKGANTITTNETCIQNVAATGTPSLTFKSTSTPVGSLILTNTSDSGISQIGSGNITVSKELATLLTVYNTEDYTSYLYYITDVSTTVAKIVPGYGVSLDKGGSGKLDIYAGNATDVLKDGTVSFDNSTHTLTLNNASGLEAIMTSLSTLDIDLVGSNLLDRSSDGSIFESLSSEPVTINLKSTGATKGSLTMEAPKSNGATLKGDNVTLTPVDPIVLLSSDVTENKGTLVYGVSYDLTVSGVSVTSANASAIQTGAEFIAVEDGGSVTFDTATSTLTLNNAHLKHGIVSGLDNLKIRFQGTNKINSDSQVDNMDIQGSAQSNAISSSSETATLTFEKTGDGTIELYAKTFSYDPVISGFASVNYGSGDYQCYVQSSVPSYYDGTGKRLVNFYDVKGVTNATITSVASYPLWIGSGNFIQVTSANSEGITGTAIESGNVSFVPSDNKLKLKNAAITSKILSGLTNLTIDVEGNCSVIIPDSGSVVRSVVAGALTITKTGTNASLRLKNVVQDSYYPVIQRFSSLTYADFNLDTETSATYGQFGLGMYGGNTQIFNMYGLYNPDETESYKKGITSATFTTATLYPLWVAGVHVTSDIASNITGTNIQGGKVSYDVETHTLTLNGTEQYGMLSLFTNENSPEPMITCNGDLTIQLIGDNSIVFSGEYANYAFKNTGTSGTLTITQSGTDATLSITSDFDGGDSKGLCDGFTAVNFANDLAYIVNQDSKSISTLNLVSPACNFANNELSFQTAGLLFGTNNGAIVGAEYFYKITYVDSSIEGSGVEHKFNLDYTHYYIDPSQKIAVNSLAGACTIETYTKLNGETSTANKAKKFGPSESPMRLVYGADPVDLVLAPAIEENDGIKINGIEANVTYNSTTGKVSSETMGSHGAVVTLTNTGETVKTILLNNYFNMDFDVVPPAPTITPDGGTLAYDQTITLSLPEGCDANIKYKWDDGSEQTYTAPIAVQTGKLTAWAVFTQESGDLVSDEATATFMKLLNPELSFSVIENVVRMGTTEDAPTLKYSTSMTTAPTVTWSSDHPEIATVDETTGVVTPVAVSATKVTITATFAGDDTYAPATASYKVEVAQGMDYLSINYKGKNIPLAKVRVTKGKTLNIKENYNLICPAEIAGDLTWTPDASTIATAADGVVSGVSCGNTRIVVAFEGNDNYEADYCEFYVDVTPLAPTINLAEGTYLSTHAPITITKENIANTAISYTWDDITGDNNATWSDYTDAGVAIQGGTLSARVEYYDAENYNTIYSDTVSVAYTVIIDPELKYMQGTKEVTTAEWTLGKDGNTLPTLQNTHNVTVTYESSNTDVATVATDGTVTVVGIGTATITATSVATDVYAAGEASYTLTVNRQLNVSFSASNTWATYCGTENLSTPEGLKAYQVTAVNGSTVTTSEIGYIPANTAVLLQNIEGKTAATNTIASAYTGATSTFPNNLLIGSTEAVDVSSINGGTVYVLYNDMFKRATSGTIPANRAYLVISGAAPARLNIVHGGDETGIDNIRMDEPNDSWYTIDGRKLNGQPQRAGFYIRNGKKVYKR